MNSDSVNSQACQLCHIVSPLCQTSFSPLCQVLHEKFTIWYGSIFAALFTFSVVCINLVVWAFIRLDGWKSAGQYLIYWLLTISRTNSKKCNCYMRKQSSMLSIPVCIASGAHNGYYVKLPVMITVLTMIGILIQSHKIGCKCCATV